MGSVVVGLNGLLVWAYVVELADGFRVRLDVNDWQKLNLNVGQRIPVRLPRRQDVWMFVEWATEVPPVAWLQLRRLRVAG